MAGGRESRGVGRGAGRNGVRQGARRFPLFTWSLYSHGFIAPIEVPELELLSIDGVEVDSAKVLGRYGGPTAQAQKQALTAALFAGEEERARGVLRTILAAIGQGDA